MPTPDEWFQIYRGQQLALEKIAADVAKLVPAGGGGGGGGGDATIPFLKAIADKIHLVKVALGGSPDPSSTAPPPEVSGPRYDLVSALNEIQVNIGVDLARIASNAEIAGRHVGSALAGGEDIRRDRLATREESVAGAIDKVAAAIKPDPVGDDLRTQVAALTAQALRIDLAPGSLSPAEHRARAEQWRAEWSEGLAKLFGRGGEPGIAAKAITALVSPVIQTAASLASSVMAPLQVPFQKVLEAGIADLFKSIEAASKAHPDDPVQVALAGILSAHRLGQAAHGLASAVELHPLFHQLGFSHMAAAVTDLSGFAPMSQAALRPYIEAAIARPMRYTTNQQFTPYIPNENVLADHVRRRTLNLTDFDAWLSKLGYAETHRDRMIETVWRDPSLRDLALALDDVDVDERWLAPRVRTIGYDDADADQIFRGLLQRTQRGPRARVVSAAAAAAADGLMPIEDYEALLRGLGLRDAIVELELRAVRIKARADYQRQALATYRRQYVSGVIGRADYELSLHALGLTPDRVDLTLADADAQRAPKLQATEEAAIKEVMSQVRTHLVPRYRALFEDGLLSGEAYREVLERAGVAPGLAAQAVSLAQTQRDVELSRTGSKTADRTLAQILSDREDLAIVQYRRGQLDDARLRVALLAVGLTPERADVVVERERVLRLPVPSRPPPIAAEAVDRLTPEFRRRASIEDYRKFRIDEATLYDELVASGRTPEQADAEVGYEYARRPAPKAAG
jgi:hypothetical protein